MAESRMKSLAIKIAKIAAITIPILLVIGFVGWSYTCPCDRTPGGYLFGAAPEGETSDWSFANDIPLCQIQIRDGLVPYSINLNQPNHPTMIAPVKPKCRPWRLGLLSQ